MRTQLSVVDLFFSPHLRLSIFCMALQIFAVIDKNGILLFGAIHDIGCAHSRHTNAKHLHMPYIPYFLSLAPFFWRLKVYPNIAFIWIYNFFSLVVIYFSLVCFLFLVQHFGYSHFGIWIINVNEEGAFMLLTWFAIEPLHTISICVKYLESYLFRI